MGKKMFDRLKKSLYKRNRKREDDGEKLTAMQVVFLDLDHGKSWQEAFEDVIDLGFSVKKETVRRYLYFWKEENAKILWQAKKRRLKEHPEELEEFATQLGVSVEVVRIAIVNSRTVNIFLRRLGVPTKREREMQENKIQKEIPAVVEKLKKISDPIEVFPLLEKEAERLGITFFELDDRLSKHLKNARFQTQLRQLLEGN